MLNKGIFYFQLGWGEFMLYMCLCLYCKDFLEKIVKLYELYVFIFGSWLYVYIIVGFLDFEKKFFFY